MKKAVLHMALAALLLAQPMVHATANAAESGTVSYRRVYELLHQFRNLPAKDTTHLRFLARAKDPDGNAPARFIIRQGNAPIVIEVNRHGLFDIPMDPELAELNPLMHAEPALPMLRLGLAIVIRVPSNGTPDVAWLRDAVRQTNAVMLARARVAPERIPQARGVTLRFSHGSNPHVLLRTTGDERKLLLDDDGRINLRLDKDVIAITFSEPPELMFPLFE